MYTRSICVRQKLKCFLPVIQTFDVIILYFDFRVSKLVIMQPAESLF